jgi:hypothetical protein
MGFPKSREVQKLLGESLLTFPIQDKELQNEEPAKKRALIKPPHYSAHS